MPLIAQLLFWAGGLMSGAPLPAPVQDDGDKRIQLPDSEAQKEAEELIRDVFRKEYNKTKDADRLDLARKLLQQAGEGLSPSNASAR